MKRRLDWFAFYASDFLNSHAVRMMSFAETGAYIKLLCEAWLDSRCSLPSDEKMLIRLLQTTPREWKVVREAVLAQFESRNGRLYNKRLDEERAEAETRSEAARLRAEKRWGNTIPSLKSQEKQDETEQEDNTPPLPLHNNTGHASADADAYADANASAQAGGRGGSPLPVASSTSLSVKRKWVHDIWLEVNPSHPLKVRQKDVDDLELLIASVGEEYATLGWDAYVSEDPPSYNLEPIERAVECEGKRGNKWIATATDGGSVTRFPLAAFLSSPEGYIEAAKRAKR